MQITVYLDLIFIINFLVDLYVLSITGKLMHQKIKGLRIGLGALFGSTVFLPCILHPGLLMGISGIILMIVISMGAVAISLGREGGFIRKWSLSTTIMVIFGGIFQMMKDRFGVLHITFYKWTIFFLLSGMAGSFLMLLLTRSRERGRYIININIQHGGREIKVCVFMDSGNRLWDAIYGKQVLLLSKEIAQKILSDDEYRIVERYKRDGYIDYNDPSFLNIQKNICFHEIAYKSVGRSSGKMLCFIVESVEVEGRNKIYYKQPVAVAQEELFSGKEYRGLIFSDDI